MIDDERLVEAMARAFWERLELDADGTADWVGSRGDDINGVTLDGYFNIRRAMAAALTAYRLATADDGK